MKPATETHWKLRRKLTQLAERGIDGEKETAARKLERLLARYDFSKGDPGAGLDIFAGTFTRSSTAIFLSSFPDQFELGSYVKWAIESGARIPGIWRNGCELWVEASSNSLPQLRRLDETVRGAFTSLWQQFAAAPTVRIQDRRQFMLGLYDGMMSDDWPTGKALPAASMPPVRKQRGGKKKGTDFRPGVTLHPYSIALELGRQIRFSVAICDITKELADRLKIAA